jgi:hypothetical protein
MCHQPTNAELLGIFAHRFVKGEIDLNQLWERGTNSLRKYITDLKDNVSTQMSRVAELETERDAVKEAGVIRDKEYTDLKVKHDALQLSFDTELDTRTKAAWLSGRDAGESERNQKLKEELRKLKDELVRTLDTSGGTRINDHIEWKLRTDIKSSRKGCQKMKNTNGRWRVEIDGQILELRRGESWNVIVATSPIEKVGDEWSYIGEGTSGRCVFRKAGSYLSTYRLVDYVTL